MRGKNAQKTRKKFSDCEPPRFVGGPVLNPAWARGPCTTHTHTHTHTRLTDFVQDYPGELYQKDKTNLDFTGARDSEWQWHQLGHMQVCISLQTDNHASTPPLLFFTDRMPFLPPNQQCESTEGNMHHTHYRDNLP